MADRSGKSKTEWDRGAGAQGEWERDRRICWRKYDRGEGVAEEKTVEAKPYAYILIRSYRVKAPWPTYTWCMRLYASLTLYVIARVRTHLVYAHTWTGAARRAGTSGSERVAATKAYLRACRNKVPFLFTTVSQVTRVAPRLHTLNPCIPDQLFLFGPRYSRP